jgi:hypothetical protein
VTWFWIVLLVIPAVIGAIVLVVSHLDSFETDFSGTANVSCPRCHQDTPPRRKVCRHCGAELQ